MEEFTNKMVNIGRIGLFVRWKYGSEDPMRSVNEQLQLCATNGSQTFSTPIFTRIESTDQIENAIVFLQNVKKFLIETREKYIEAEKASGIYEDLKKLETMGIR